MERLIAWLRDMSLFLLAVQLTGHFLPGKQYEKYGRLIIGIVVLARFAGFFLNLSETALLPQLDAVLENAALPAEQGGITQEQRERFSERMQEMEAERERAVGDGLVRSVEERLAGPAERAGVTVEQVELSEGILRIRVRSRAGPEREGAEREGARIGVSPVEIGRIRAGENERAAPGTEPASLLTQAGASGQKGVLRRDLCGAFSAALGMGEEDLEVIEIEPTAGMVQEADDEG